MSALRVNDSSLGVFRISILRVHEARNRHVDKRATSRWELTTHGDDPGGSGKIAQQQDQSISKNWCDSRSVSGRETTSDEHEDVVEHQDQALPISRKGTE